MPMTDEAFEKLAKKYAAGLLGHHDDYRAEGYSKSNGIILMRLWRNKRSNALAYMADFFTRVKVNPLTLIDECDHEAFTDQVLAYAVADGFDVEWAEED